MEVKKSQSNLNNNLNSNLNSSLQECLNSRLEECLNNNLNSSLQECLNIRPMECLNSNLNISLQKCLNIRPEECLNNHLVLLVHKKAPHKLVAHRHLKRRTHLFQNNYLVLLVLLLERHELKVVGKKLIIEVSVKFHHSAKKINLKVVFGASPIVSQDIQDTQRPVIKIAPVIHLMVGLELANALQIIHTDPVPPNLVQDVKKLVLSIMKIAKKVLLRVERSARLSVPKAQRTQVSRVARN